MRFLGVKLGVKKWPRTLYYIILLENKILTLESKHNSLEQYGLRNNIEITGILDSVSNQNLEEKVVDILNEISVNVSPKDIEACHRVGVSKNS